MPFQKRNRTHPEVFWVAIHSRQVASLVGGLSPLLESIIYFYIFPVGENENFCYLFLSSFEQNKKLLSDHSFIFHKIQTESQLFLAFKLNWKSDIHLPLSTVFLPLDIIWQD